MSSFHSSKDIRDDEEGVPIFLQQDHIKKQQTKGRSESVSNTRGTYKIRCINISLLSNYVLYLVFFVQTIAFIYYCFIFEGETDPPCYANYYDYSIVAKGAGRNITDRFD